MPTERRTRGIRPRWLVLLIVVLTAVFIVVRLSQTSWPGQDGNPFAERAGYVAPGSKAVVAAGNAPSEVRDLVQEIATTPTGIWLTPEEWPVDRVGARVREIVAGAEQEDAVPLLVIYGIPGRDCSGGHSSGGTTVEDYLAWVREIATRAGGRSAVVLEPDALATAAECGRVEERLELLSEAVQILIDEGPTTYVDAGHSGWLPASQMAGLLRAVGIDQVRGFATNVAAYQSTAEERAYAEELSTLVGGAAYVIDSGRSGNGANGEWCNPVGRALGERPGAVDDGSGLDAYLWVKPPGESDGECNGGPPAGEWWTERALELARNAGW